MDSKKLDFVKMVSSSIMKYLPSVDGDVTRWIVAQFCLESDFGRSPISNNRHNICGMRQPTKRLTCALPESKVFACYSSYDVCIVDYLMCLAYHGCTLNHLQTISNYRTFIGRFYCPDHGYLNCVDKLYMKLCDEFFFPF